MLICFLPIAWHPEKVTAVSGSDNSTAINGGVTNPFVTPPFFVILVPFLAVFFPIKTLFFSSKLDPVPVTEWLEATWTALCESSSCCSWMERLDPSISFSGQSHHRITVTLASSTWQRKLCRFHWCFLLKAALPSRWCLADVWYEEDVVCRPPPMQLCPNAPSAGVPHQKSTD